MQLTRKFHDMSHNIKIFALLLFISSFIFLHLSSCNKDANATYELILKADISTTGNTIFGEIKYNDGTIVQSIVNSTTSFSKTVPLTTVNQPIFFGVIGGVKGLSAATPPNFSISYEVDKVNGTARDIICFASNPSSTYANGVWSFNLLVDRYFTGTNCN